MSNIIIHWIHLRAQTFRHHDKKQNIFHLQCSLARRGVSVTPSSLLQWRIHLSAWKVKQISRKWRKAKRFSLQLLAAWSLVVFGGKSQHWLKCHAKITSIVRLLYCFLRVCAFCFYLIQALPSSSWSHRTRYDWLKHWKKLKDVYCNISELYKNTARYWQHNEDNSIIMKHPLFFTSFFFFCAIEH